MPERINKMFQVKKEKELESFSKNKKNATVLSSILIVGTITLFCTFAFLKKEKLDYLHSMHLNSVKVENKEVDFIPERGLYKTNVECMNGYGEWDYNS